MESQTGCRHFSSDAKYIDPGIWLDRPIYRVVIPIGSRAAKIRSCSLSCNTHENIPSRYFGASMSCSRYYRSLRRFPAQNQPETNQGYYDLTIRSTLKVVWLLQLFPQHLIVVYLSIDSECHSAILTDEWLRTSVLTADQLHVQSISQRSHRFRQCSGARVQELFLNQTIVKSSKEEAYTLVLFATTLPPVLGHYGDSS
jgi:hypothetical protein